MAQAVVIILTLFNSLMASVQGDYVLRIQLSGYSNPLNTCYQCTWADGGVQGCCDTTDPAGVCVGNRACDNEFFYCLMPLGNMPLADTIVDTETERNLTTRAGRLGCLQPPVALRSDVNHNGGTVDFTSDTVLGLPNPLVFEMTADRWQGVALYVDVIDRDFGTTIDDLIDVFLVRLSPPDIMAGANTTTPQQYSGRFGFTNIELSFELECLPGFFGEECTMTCDSFPCDNGGLCSPDTINGFTCTCVGDFTGRLCDVMIDNCLNVNCNNGTCVDGVGTFTCECEADYTGQFCEETLTLTTSSPGISSGAVAGAVIGSIIFMLLIVCTAVVLSLALKKWQTKSISKLESERNSDGNVLHNPIYDPVTASPAENLEESDADKDWDNPIYGLPDIVESEEVNCDTKT